MGGVDTNERRNSARFSAQDERYLLRGVLGTTMISNVPVSGGRQHQQADFSAVA